MIALSPWCHKAKALLVAASCGWSTRAVRHSPPSISASSKLCSKLTKTRLLAVMSLRYFFPKARWAFVLRSCILAEGRSERSSACPFGKTTCILSIQLTILHSISNTSHFEPKLCKNTWSKKNGEQKTLAQTRLNVSNQDLPESPWLATQRVEHRASPWTMQKYGNWRLTWVKRSTFARIICATVFFFPG